MSERIQLHDRAGTPTGDLDIPLCETCDMREVVNGEHSLSIDTTQELSEGMRMLHADGTGKVREWVVDEATDSHSSDGHVHSYGATWSMQYDLATSYGGELWVSDEEGTHEPITAATALGIVLDGDSTWEAGNVTLGTTGACSLYDGSRWDYLKKLIDTFGGEMEPRIVTSSVGTVIHRYVDWHAHLGTTDVTRRFDFGADCTSIDRHVEPGPRYTRVRPRGGGTKTDNDGVDYSERVGLEDITAEDMAEMDGWTRTTLGDYANDDLRFALGTGYIEDVRAAADFDYGNHPEKTVIYDVTQLKSGYDVCELFAKASEDVLNHTRPKVTYEAEVEQFAAAGMDAKGVALGDEVYVVDARFKPEPLRIKARVTEITRSLIDTRDMQLVIGNHLETLATSFRELQRDTAEKVSAITAGGTLVYVNELLKLINDEINALGGYSYLIDGEGIITYDIAVDDPMVGYNATTGEYASRVVQVKGGTIRFANTKNPSFAGINDWNWTNVITADGYLGLAATIANITSGIIHDADDNTVIDLDNGTVTFKNGIIHDANDNTVIDLDNGRVTFRNGLIQSANGTNYWNLGTGEFRLSPSALIGDSSSSQTLATYVSENGFDEDAAYDYLTDSNVLQGIFVTENGRLYINGSYIRSGTIDASKVTVNNLNADNITSGTINSSRINTAQIKADVVNGLEITGEQINGGTISGVTLISTGNTSNVKISNGVMRFSSGSTSRYYDIDYYGEGFRIASSTGYEQITVLPNSINIMAHPYRIVLSASGSYPGVAIEKYVGSGAWNTLASWS